MLEINKHTLKDAISRLPQHTPADSLWDSLELELDKTVEQEKLQETISELPVHNPPDLVWDKIDAALSEKEKPTAKVVGMPLFRRIAVAAAMIGVLFAMLFGLQKTDEGVQIAYSTETVEQSFFAQDWNEDEDAFTYVKELCDSNAPVCKTPAFMDLKVELDELEVAKEELQAVIGEYETNSDLIMQLAKIERERSDTLKLMLAMII